MTCLMVKKMAENSSKDGAYEKLEMEMKWKLEIENEMQMEAKNVPIASAVSSSWTHELCALLLLLHST